MEQRRRVDFTYPQFLHGIPFMAKEPGVKLQTERSMETLTLGRDSPQTCEDN
jgi:hypothetical protein